MPNVVIITWLFTEIEIFENPRTIIDDDIKGYGARDRT